MCSSHSVYDFVGVVKILSFSHSYFFGERVEVLFTLTGRYTQKVEFIIIFFG